MSGIIETLQYLGCCILPIIIFFFYLTAITLKFNKWLFADPLKMLKKKEPEKKREPRKVIQIYHNGKIVARTADMHWAHEWIKSNQEHTVEDALKGEYKIMEAME